MKTTRQAALDVATGVAAALIVFGAVPTVLVVFVGLPLPRQWSVGGVISWNGLFDALAVVTWCSWAGCAWPLLLSVASRVRRGDTSTAPGSRLVDQLAVRIAVAVLAVSPVIVAAPSQSGATMGSTATTPGQAPVPAFVSTTSRPVTGLASSPGTGSARPSVVGVAPLPSTGSYTVESGDSLWSIAEACYDDGAAWQAIATANLGRTMDDGQRFVDPAVIQPGWTLLIPTLDGDRPAPPAPPAAPTASTAADAANADVTTTAARPSPSRNATVSPSGAPHVELGLEARGDAGLDGRTPDRAPAKRPSPGPLPLPQLAVVGCGVLLAALIARRTRRAYRLVSFFREEGVPIAMPTNRGAEVATAIDGFDRTPMVQWAELAARHLTAALSSVSSAGVRDLPAMRLVRVGRDGVEVRFDGTPRWTAAGWIPMGQSSWLLPSSTDPSALEREAGRSEPWCPLLVPIGENAEGSWLVPLTPGMHLSVVGPRANDLVSAVRAALSSWTWHDELTVTSEVSVAAAAALRDATALRAGGSAPARVLFIGDDRLLPSELRAACAVVSTQMAGHSALTVLVDSRAASLHPYGVTVRPHLLDDDTATAIEELGTMPVVQPKRGPGTVSLVDRRPDRSTLTLPSGSATAATAPWTVPARAGRLSGLERGPIDVRLLCTVPRIDGLRCELMPKRARRAVELVAYLAMHSPDPVTGDRLRNRVLGSSDADAAAKTLFNTASAARRAMGVDDRGRPLFPAATRSGHYALSTLVTADAVRLTRLIAAGTESARPDQSLALLREGLAQIEGEPLAGVLTGYGWWRGEGHERRISDTVVDGACRLVRTAIATHDLDLARWAVEQARRVEPCSEALTRVAMELAAAAGDARRLHLEWRDCLRQMDDLDPGSMPSEATELLYARLRAQLSAGARHQGDAVVVGA